MKKVISLLVLGAVLMPLLAGAAIVEIKNPLARDDGTGVNTFDELIKRIIIFTRQVATAVAPIMIIVAGFFFITSAGDPEKINTAKRLLLWTLIGFGVILLAEGMINFFQEAIDIN